MQTSLGFGGYSVPDCCFDQLKTVTSFNSQSTEIETPSLSSDAPTEDPTNATPPRQPQSSSSVHGGGIAVAGSSHTPGRISPPSAVCSQRRMSKVVVTADDAEHEFLDGRPKIQFESIGVAGATASSGGTKKKPLLPRVPVIKRACTVPIDQRLLDFALQPPPLRIEHWADPPASTFKVRGKNYLHDGLKVNSDASLFKLMAVDLVKVEQPLLTGLCGHPRERLQLALRRERETGIRELPDFVFAVNYCVPGDPYFHWVAYFGIDDVSRLRDPSTPLGRLAEPFFFGESDEFRTDTFKLIPRIVEGNFVVRKAVGSKPSILGRKLKQYYIRNERYFELVVDIGSDAVADRIVKLALGAAKNLVVDMMFVLEGAQEATLPERILGGARMQYLDFKRKDLQRRCTTPF